MLILVIDFVLRVSNSVILTLTELMAGIESVYWWDGKVNISKHEYF